MYPFSLDQKYFFSLFWSSFMYVCHPGYVRESVKSNIDIEVISMGFIKAKWIYYLFNPNP